MFHAGQWLNKPRFFSPMAFSHDGTHIFIHDCANCLYPPLDMVKCVVTKFFKKVCCTVLCAAIINIILGYSWRFIC